MNNQAVKWKIYIVGHKKIHEDLTRGDKRFNNHNYTFLNVGQMEKLENSEQKPYAVVEFWEEDV